MSQGYIVIFSFMKMKQLIQIRESKDSQSIKILSLEYKKNKISFNKLIVSTRVKEVTVVVFLVLYYQNYFTFGIRTIDSIYFKKISKTTNINTVTSHFISNTVL